ncbi:hypothetical protein [Halocatena marina]|uniref:hypothetical protein n=1 Tax=Halocatena marina TaxID=2934937 RepID=UPI00200BC9FF|nr:hypothetical protein [Halocatena marina]
MGFERDADGYLQVVLDPARDAGEVGYLDVRRAIERVDEGESYRRVSRDVPNLARTTLMSIHKDDERQQWYLGGEADDERVDAVLIAAWGLFVLFLTGSGIFRFVNGWRKTRSSRSRKIREGRKEMKGSFYAFGAALIVIGAERLFAFWIVDVMDCALALVWVCDKSQRTLSADIRARLVLLTDNVDSNTYHKSCWGIANSMISNRVHQILPLQTAGSG